MTTTTEKTATTGNEALAAIFREVAAETFGDMRKNLPGAVREALGKPSFKSIFADEYENFDHLGGKGATFGQFARVRYESKVTNQPMQIVAKSMAHARKIDGPIADWLDSARYKALAESTMADGGALVPPEISAEFIPVLRANEVLRAAGIKVIPMSKPQLEMGRQNSPAVAAYVGENVAVTASQQAFGQLNFLSKKIMGITAASNEVFADGGPALDTIVRDDLAAVLGLRSDLAGIRGDGTSNTPRGLRNLINAANIFNDVTGATPTPQQVATLLGKMELAIKSANVPEIRRCLLIHPRTEVYLLTLLNTQGLFVFRDEMINKGTILGRPYKTTTQIPITLGAGVDSEIYLQDFGHYMLGEHVALQIEVFPNGTYNDASGTLISGISSDQTVVRARMSHDYQIRYDKSGAITTGVEMGS